MTSGPRLIATALTFRFGVGHEPEVPRNTICMDPLPNARGGLTPLDPAPKLYRGTGMPRRSAHDFPRRTLVGLGRCRRRRPPGGTRPAHGRGGPPRRGKPAGPGENDFGGRGGGRKHDGVWGNRET